MSEGRRLDPSDWDTFARDFHALADDCLNHMRTIRSESWRPRSAGLDDRVSLNDAHEPTPVEEVFKEITQGIMPHHSGNAHPRFFGWVQGAGLPQAVAAEMAAAAMNSNCGGRDHGATDVESAVIEWAGRVAGFDTGSFGILTTGTSQATIVALACARVRRFGADVRRKGIAAFPQVRVYAAQGSHSCIGKALEILGHGSDALSKIPTDENGRMNVALLREALQDDVAMGRVPLAIVGTAGSVNLGTFDPLDRIADIAAEHDAWFHVDGAFGFWTRLADEPFRSLADGIECADSIAADFHKWMSVPYDCGICILADRALQRETFSSRPEYLAPQNAGLGGGDTWFCDYGPELSRGFRALKVWATIKACGVRSLGDAVTDNCRQAALMARLVDQSPWLDTAHPVVSNVATFFPRHGDASRIAATLQIEGEVVFSTTIVGGRNALRAAIVNHRTTNDDVVEAVRAVERKVEAASNERLAG